MNEMCLKGYRFVILDGAFLVHVPGIKRRSEVTMERAAWRHPHERRNIKMYHSITVKMMRKYGTNTRCKL
jgi:N-acetyllactosaminide beta-1,3-N-acetylglucosaminyltransferase